MDAKSQMMMNTMAPFMGMLESMTSGIKSENEVSKFVEENFKLLLDTKEEIPMLEMGKGLFAKALIAEANQDPVYVEAKMLKFYEAFRQYYKAKHERK